MPCYFLNSFTSFWEHRTDFPWERGDSVSKFKAFNSEKKIDHQSKNSAIKKSSDFIPYNGYKTRKIVFSWIFILRSPILWCSPPPQKKNRFLTHLKRIFIKGEGRMLKFSLRCRILHNVRDCANHIQHKKIPQNKTCYATF